MGPEGSWLAYKGAVVTKNFIDDSSVLRPFKGEVVKVDPKDRRTPFQIRYEDGDGEWISYKELKAILVKQAQGGAEADAQPKKKRGRPAKGHPQQAAASGEGVAADANGSGAAADAPSAKRTKQQQHKGKDAMLAAAVAAAAAAGDAEEGGGSDDYDDTGKQLAPDQAGKAAAAKGPAAGGAAAGPHVAAPAAAGAAEPAATRAGPTGAAAAASPGPAFLSSLTDALDTAAEVAAAAAAAAGTGVVPGTAEKPARAAAEDEGQAAAAAAGSATVQRMRFSGPGSAGRPDSSTWVTHSGVTRVTLVSKPTANAVADTDYRREARQLLEELALQLEGAGSSKEALLEVTVFFKNIVYGLPAFNNEWRKWADRRNLPVVTAVEGRSAVPDAGLTVQATAVVL